jgi:hypothetical protein
MQIQDCGEILYGDFRDDDAQELDELEEYLQRDESGNVQHVAGGDADEVTTASMSSISSCTSPFGTPTSSKSQVCVFLIATSTSPC